MDQHEGSEHCVKIRGGSLEEIPFSHLPVHDTVWSLIRGFDGRIYAAACGEHTGGLSAFVIRYDPVARRLDYLSEVAPATGNPPGDGHATHAKIHYSMLPYDEKRLICATHCSGPPAGDPVWSPWSAWDDPQKCFTGFPLFFVNTETGEVENLGVKMPREGCRCLAIDHARKRLFGISYPRDHFFIYDVEEDHFTDLGRIGDRNPQCIVLDSEGNACTFDDLGFLVRYDTEEARLEHLDVKLPHAPFRNGRMCTIYDAVRRPGTNLVYGCTWSFDGRLFRFNPDTCEMEDLGRAFGPEDTDSQDLNYPNHVGGLVFGSDGWLYFATAAASKEAKCMYLVRMHPDTLEREELGPFKIGERLATYVSRACMDDLGNLYFAGWHTAPIGLFVFRPDEPGPFVKDNPIRAWG